MENFRKETRCKKISMRKELEWTLKIWEISLKIEGQHGEFYKFKEEMPLVIPNAENLEITLKNLEEYYDSLTSMLNKYISENHNCHKLASKIK